MEHFRWKNPQQVKVYKFVCGYCGQNVASEKGWEANQEHNNNNGAQILLCPNCSGPTFFSYRGDRMPAAAMGAAVAGISEPSVEQLYREARRATAAGCNTAAVLCCRKLLMHIAVAKGASEGENFVAYVEFLSDKHYVPPDAKEWVDHIRKRGNEANHEINMMKEEDAAELIAFVEMLLKLIYEFPAAIKKKITAGQ
jgi:hypothetical protein